MKFGSLSVSHGEQTILAHAIKRPGLSLKKGQVVNSADIAALLAAGVHEILVARLEADDVHEDVAAGQLAESLAGPHVVVESPFTGRCNLYAGSAGIFIVDAKAIDRINALDEAIAIATVTAFKPVVPGELIATIKIIPFAIPRKLLALASSSNKLICVAPYRQMKVGVIFTLLPGFKSSVVAKTLDVLNTRLAPASATIGTKRVVCHEVDALAHAIGFVASRSDLLIIFGASAITDRRDVIPSAITRAGGEITHLGMPVDPGNLLLLAALPFDARAPVPVIGAPGCARSPKENGFDFVLRRILAGVFVTGADLAQMGVGGLLSTSSLSKEELLARQEAKPQDAIIVEQGEYGRQNLSTSVSLAEVGPMPRQ